MHDVELQHAWKTLFGPSIHPAVLNETAVRRAYRRRVLEIHPDVAGAGATPQFLRVTKAYEVLLGACGSSILQSRRASIQDGNVRALPARPLALAQFLYHLGWISWESVQHALRWQAKHRIRIGELAVQSGALTRQQLLRIVEHQRSKERWGRCALRLGLVDASTLSRLVERQTRLQPPVGQYFVQHGLVSSERLAHALALQRQHNELIRENTKPTER
ncbi:MAG TPA: DnaJ domain-containing protein [Polyangiaceae bacterium]|mgnify:CR=1 FL=1|jgi:hypothetical protein|nr:MAG: bacteriophage N4 adsorption protein B [Deltaproteobacteria bacterium ADurb.Bin207]HQB46027.1 DnaJ domain-containing protein [Polyangiaceae bacterium]HQM08894.1 DnaJ domain-containing protein [Polyangiaceae bacterium]